MSRHVHNAGAFYAYISRGLGGTAGASAAMVALVAYNALQVGIYGIFGFEVSGSWPPTPTWRSPGGYRRCWPC